MILAIYNLFIVRTKLKINQWLYTGRIDQFPTSNPMSGMRQ